jgi:hypothetical protein
LNLGRQINGLVLRSFGDVEKNGTRRYYQPDRCRRRDGGRGLHTGAAAAPGRYPVSFWRLEIEIGAIVGPQVLGWVHPGLVMDFLADVGLGMLFLMAGFEIEPNVLRGAPIRNAIAGWFISAALAFAVAMVLLKVRLATDPTLTALSLSTTAIGALMPILRDSHLLVAPYGPMVLAGGAMGEAAPGDCAVAGAG